MPGAWHPGHSRPCSARSWHGSPRGAVGSFYSFVPLVTSFFSAAAKVAWRVAAIQRALHGGPVAAAPATRQAQQPQVQRTGDTQPAPQQQANQHSAGKEHAGGSNKHKGQALENIKAVGIKNWVCDFSCGFFATLRQILIYFMRKKMKKSL